MQAARETSLEFARATAPDPVAAGHFQDSADSYLKVPPIPPDASLDALSRREIDRLERTFTGTGNGVYEGIEALNTRPSRSAEMVEDDESTAMWSANPPLARETLPCSFGSSVSSRASTRPPTLETW